jgi:large subunit ribosomal protein L35
MHRRKPHKGLKKRVRVTRNGKVVRRMSFKSKLMSGKSGRRRQRLRRIVLIEGGLAEHCKRALCQE